MITLIKNARLWTGYEDISNACIILDGDRITYAGKQLHAPAISPYKTIDAKGGIVSPAFYSSHSHIAMSLMRGAGSDLPLMDWLGVVNPIEDRLDSEKVYIGSMLSCMELMRNGCVCFNDMYMFMDATAQAVNDSGIRAAITRGIVRDQALEENIRLYEKWNGKASGRIHVGFGPYAEYGCSESLYRKCIEEAAKRRTYIHTHASETIAEVEQCKERHKGLTPIRLLNELGFFDIPNVVAHCVWADDEEISILAQKGAWVSHNPSSNAKLGSGIAPVAKMLEHGVKVSLGTDGPASSNIQDMQSEMRLMALLQKASQKDASVMKAEACLKIACENGANACTFRNAGVIRAGADADLIIFDAKAENMLPVFDAPSAIVYAARGRNVTTTICAGNVVYENGTFPLFDTEAVLKKASRLFPCLLGDRETI
ncbi:MAG: amidohydrolase [Clostridia bacterium]|nr:amidohydrolase [Clostridia bacterium]